MPLLVDSMARRYGKWPHEVLRLSPWEFELARIAYQAGSEHSAAIAERSIEKGAQGVVLVSSLTGA